MRIFGALLIAFGFLISLSIVGAFIGIPMMLIGLVCLIAGGRRKTVINNVISVNSSDRQERQEPDEPYLPARREPKLIEAAPLLPPSKRAPKAYDEEKWGALVRYDEDIARIVAALQPYGQKYVDELAAAYLAINDKEYLPRIIKKILESAQRDAGAQHASTVRQRGQV